MHQKGFTLMEVLIAVAITAVIGLGVWQVLSGVVLARDRVNEAADDFDQIQRTMLLLERDLTQLVNRPARDVYGDFQPALSSRQEEFELVLTRQGWRNPLGTRRSSLQRVAWEYTGEELRRRYWLTLDQGQEDNSQDVLVLPDITAFDIRFLDDQRNWTDGWPTEEALAGLNPGARPDIPLPLGIQVTLEHERFGELVRTFAVADFDGGIAQGMVNAANEANSESDADEQTDDESQLQDGQVQGQGEQPPGGVTQ